jgi:hypothetical protein
MRRRSYSDEQFLDAVRQSKSWAEVLRRLGLKIGGGTQTYLRNLAMRLNTDTSHFTGMGWNIGLRFQPNPPKALIEILVKGRLYSNTDHIRKRLICEGLKKAACEVCKRKSWMRKPIPLQLDHINGQRSDNRLKNLRVLCPNCHAQTNTYCGKNKGNYGKRRRRQPRLQGYCPNQ